MREVQASAKSVKQLLRSSKYRIDYYQREYKWQTKQVQELLEDLAESFHDDYKPEHERREVRNYGQYFLGSVILSDKDTHTYVVDGQQRLTTLTLLLTYLNHQQNLSPGRVALDDLIFSEAFGERSFNIDVEERTPVMQALYDGQPYDPTDKPESVRNIVARFADITNLFPQTLQGDPLPYFIDWLIEKVHVVEIRAFSDEDAYTIFETMNDRGLSLTPLDMLKGYLLANITDPRERNASTEVWQRRLEQLAGLGKEEDADAVKSWLRSQHALSIRERRRGATPRDFDRIGTEFHRWIRDNEEALGLRTSSDFAQFIHRDMNFYTRQYQRVREAASKLTPGLERVFYNAQLGFTLQYPFLLAALRPEDPEETVLRKLRIAALYADIVLAWRLWNWRVIDYSPMQYRMFTEIRDVRGKSPEEMVEVVRGKLEAEEETIGSNSRLGLHQRNRYTIHRILARITDHVEQQSGQPSRYAEYIAEGRNRFEVEHIWANKFEEHGHTQEFGHLQDFLDKRNRLGGLLLLPRSFNASYGALPYEEKREKYITQNVPNLLARSLHPAAYHHNPGFCQYVERSGLPFRPYEHFGVRELEERQELYGLIAREIWNPELLVREVGG